MTDSRLAPIRDSRALAGRGGNAYTGARTHARRRGGTMELTGNKPLTAAVCAGLLLAAVAAPAGEAAAPKLEVLADVPFAPGNITVAADGTVVISTHPSFAADVTGLKVAPDHTVSPFPHPEDGAKLQRVLSVRNDDAGHVWMLSGTPGPAKKDLYVVDLKSGAIVRTIAIDAPGSFL
ncbi:MAG TPA: hypothetical protein VMH77_07770, partial [Steroidobacteraceae bacterium]|nr:hypothetical protein [Steroidobacteraceae bacterium]